MVTVLSITFPSQVEDAQIKYAVIVARRNGKWLFCRHSRRTTLECPGGHREEGETPLEAARRELYEETGAVVYDIVEIGPYRVTRFGGGCSCGMLYKAEIAVTEALPQGSEIAETVELDALPHNWTYPEIQPRLLKRAFPGDVDVRTYRHCTAAYVMDRQGLVYRDEDAGAMDQLNFSFGLVKDGSVTGSHWRSIEAYKAYVARHPHILPVLSVGGWGAGGFSEAAATHEGRSRFVESTMALLEKHGFLGLDIDWEYPGSSVAEIASSPDDKENFTLLMQTLRDGLDALTAKDGKHRLLACALGASASLVENIECEKIGRIADQINLMTYDMYRSRFCGHHTALLPSEKAEYMSAAQAVADYTAAGIPAEKIMLGCALYARVFAHDGQCMPPLFAPSPSIGSETMPYFRIKADASLTFAMDDTAKAAYAYDSSRFLTFDTPASIACKLDYVKSNHLMGLMCWEYGEDDQGELLRAMHGDA